MSDERPPTEKPPGEPPPQPADAWRQPWQVPPQQAEAWREPWHGTPQPVLNYSYAAPAKSSIPGALAITGIVYASLGFLATLYALIQALSMVMMSSAASAMTAARYSSTGAVTVSLGNALVGGLLAAALMTGSIGLLRYRPWSRRVLIWWGIIYLLADAIFFVLQLLIVVPNQVATMQGLFTAMPQPTIVAPAGPAAAAPTTAPGAAATQPVAAAPLVVVAAPPNMQFAAMAPMMSSMYEIWAVTQALICLIFPIILLIMLNLSTMRTLFADNPGAAPPGAPGANTAGPNAPGPVS